MLLFCASGVASTPTWAEQSPLLEVAQALHCTVSEQQAATLIAKLAQKSIEPFGLPDENLVNQSNTELYAATVDIVLRVLYETIQRYPKLRKSIEKTVLHWNFCAVINEGALADLTISPKTAILQKRAIGPFPAKRRGFKTWGFLHQDAAKRYVPQILKSLSPFPAAYQDFIHRLTQQQCFPHPDVEEQPTTQSPYSGAYRITSGAQLAMGKKYPYTWSEQCPEQLPLQPEKKAAPKFVKKPSPKANINIPLKHEKTVTNVAPPIEKQLYYYPTEAQNVPPESPPPQQPAPVKELKLKTVLHPLPLPKPAKIDHRYQDAIALIFQEYKQPTDRDVKVIMPTIPTIGEAPIPPPVKDSLGFSGNIHHTANLMGALSFGVNASYKLFSYASVSCNLNFTYEPATNGAKYACNIGYYDWHPGTFSLRLPMLDNSGFSLKTNAASIGYQFDSELLKSYNLSASANISSALSGSPSIGTTWQWTPKDHWFIRAGIQRSLDPQGDWSWIYGFGYSDYHPFSWSLTYDNWGYNPILNGSSQDSFNFKQNGVVTLSWSWAF